MSTELEPDVYPITKGMKASVMLECYLKAERLRVGDTFSFNAYLAWLGEKQELFCGRYGKKLVDNRLPDKETQQRWLEWLRNGGWKE